MPFRGVDVVGSRDVLGGGPESSMDRIDMLLPGRVDDDGAGNSRRPEKGGGGGGGGGTCDMEGLALYCGEGGSMGRPMTGGGGGGGGGTS